MKRRRLVTRQAPKSALLLGLALVAFAGLSRAAAGPQTEPAPPAARFHVGYKVLDFTYASAGKEKTLTVAVWYPTAEQPRPYVYGGPTRGNVAPDAKLYAEPGPYPLLVFSHGYGGSGLSAVFLNEPLASRGWIVAAPDHHDRHSAVRIRTGRNENLDRRDFLRHAGEISRSGPDDRAPYLYRLEELKLVLGRMLASKPFGQSIDKNRIAVGGHSFGGFTALGLCGTIPEWRDDRIKAVLLFSTGAGGYLFTDKELAAVKMPSIYFLGEREKDQLRASATMAELADKVYRNLSPPKYFLEIRGASHFSFNNGFVDNPRARLLSGADAHFDLIRRYSIAFLETYVAGRNDAAPLLQRRDPLLTRYLTQTAPNPNQN